MSNEKTPSKGLWLTIIVLALVGLGLSAYLTHIHVGVHTDPNFSASCDASKTVSCSRVALSSYAVMAGMPTAVWGLIGYFFVLLVGFFGWRRRSRKASSLHGMLFLLTAICCAAGLFFAYISAKKVGAFCPQCMGTYAVNVVLFVVAFMVLRGDNVSIGQAFHAFASWLPRGFIILFIAGILVVSTAIAYPKYWKSKWGKFSLPKNVCQGTVSDSDMGHGTDKEGNHWIGAKNPRVTIVEFADYECPYCKKAHFELRSLLRKCSTTIRLYHRHYPLDHKCNPRINRPFHKKACLLAKAAYCASKQGKFWEANDFLYRNGKSTEKKDLVEAMTRLGLKGDKLHSCIQSKEATKAINQDMAAGRGHKMQGTPFFVMNKVPYHKGFIPKETIIKTLEQIDTTTANKTVKASAHARVRPVVEKRSEPRRAVPVPRRTPTTRRVVVPTARRAAPIPRRAAPPIPPTFRPLTPPSPTTPTPHR